MVSLSVRIVRERPAMVEKGVEGVVVRISEATWEAAAGEMEGGREARARERREGGGEGEREGGVGCGERKGGVGCGEREGGVGCGDAGGVWGARRWRGVESRRIREVLDVLEVFRGGGRGGWGSAGRGFRGIGVRWGGGAGGWSGRVGLASGSVELCGRGFSAFIPGRRRTVSVFAPSSRR